MTQNEPKNSDIILYQTQDGEAKIEVKLDGETVWLTQLQMADLFQRTKSVISRHIRKIFDDGELDEQSTVSFYETVQKEGDREVTRTIEYYNLDMIISVGYRVKSQRGVQFRMWATQTLREYLVKGFVMNDERLAGGQQNYFDELLERVRAIRTSEHNLYDKVKAIFTTSIDYDVRTDYAQQFFATVQNKFHYAIHEHTAAELIVKRIGSDKQNMGLTNWRGKIITSDDAKVAKNYLEELELKRMQLLADQFLSYAELQVVEKRAMYMVDWLRKLDAFIAFNEKEVLTHAGKVSRKAMESVVRDELAKYNKRLQSGEKAQLESATPRLLQDEPELSNQE